MIFESCEMFIYIKNHLYIKHFPSRVQVINVVVARSPENFSRGLSPVFSGNFDRVEVNYQLFEGALAQLMYVRGIILHI